MRCEKCKIATFNIPAIFSNLVCWEKIFKSFLLWLPWQPVFFMEHNYLKEFERGLGKVFSRKSLRTHAWMKGQTDGLTDRRTHDRHNTMTIASASGAKNRVNLLPHNAAF